MGKDRLNEKEIFELWWEYLKESKGYKNWLRVHGEVYRAILNQLNNACPSDAPIPIKIAEPQFTTLFHMFGDIHNTSFEDWWKQREERRITNPAFKEIDDYSNLVEIDILQCFTNMKEKAIDQKIFEEQFRRKFLERMKSQALLHLAVDVNADLNKLTKEFRKMVMKCRKEKESELWIYRLHQYPSMTRVRLNELKSYLSTYRESLRHKSWEKTMLALNPAYESALSNTKKRENLRILYYDHIAIAKRLIKNAENGDFPGHYRLPCKK